MWETDQKELWLIVCHLEKVYQYGSICLMDFIIIQAMKHP